MNLQDITGEIQSGFTGDYRRNPEITGYYRVFFQYYSNLQGFSGLQGVWEARACEFECRIRDRLWPSNVYSVPMYMYTVASLTERVP